MDTGDDVRAGINDCQTYFVNTSSDYEKECTARYSLYGCRSIGGLYSASRPRVLSDFPFRRPPEWVELAR